MVYGWDGLLGNYELSEKLNIFRDIAMPFRIFYNASRQKRSKCFHVARRKAPEVKLRGFSIPNSGNGKANVLLILLRRRNASHRPLTT